MPPRLKSIKIKGYRPFRDFSAQLGSLEVIVGANGSGKSSLFEFLRFLRDSMSDEIPPEIIPGSIGQRIFHSPGPEKFSWDIEHEYASDLPSRYLEYEGELMGPAGNPHLLHETLRDLYAEGKKANICMKFEGINGFIVGSPTAGKREPFLKKWNQLALSLANNPLMGACYDLRERILHWRFYNSFDISRDKIRRPVLIEQTPILDEDAGNLGTVLNCLKLEHESVFDEIQQHLRSAVPGFKGLMVKPYGAPGHVMTFWQEDGVGIDLTLADLSDGVLQLICWMALCLQPNLPSLICIDEPEQGVHPRTLPFLAGLLKKASNRTQILLATHSSYFLTQFDISRIAVMRKENGAAEFRKPRDSKVLTSMLEDFGKEEIEALHISDELEYFA